MHVKFKQVRGRVRGVHARQVQAGERGSERGCTHVKLKQVRGGVRGVHARQVQVGEKESERSACTSISSK